VTQNLKVLAVLPAIIPSTIMNVIRPLTALHRRGDVNVRIRLEESLRPNDLDWPGLVVFCRNIEPAGMLWLDHLEQHHIPFIYDLDDDFINAPVETSVGKRMAENPVCAATFKRYLSQASRVRVYAPVLAETIQPWSSNVCLMIPPLDWSSIRATKKQRDQRIRIVYATSRTTGDHLASIFLPALERILGDYQSNVEMHFWGTNPMSGRKDQNIFSQPFLVDYEEYLKRFSSAGFDIGLAPLYDDLFHRSKTNVKFREYGASKIAGVYSNVSVYGDYVQHRETGLLVGNSVDEWYGAIKELIENESLRLHIQQQVYQRVQTLFSAEKFQDSWCTQIKEVTDEPFTPHSYSYTNFMAENRPRPEKTDTKVSKYSGKMNELRQVLHVGGLSGTARLLDRYFRSMKKRIAIQWELVQPKIRWPGKKT
jgi:glycosyltransferase involved in cell wall biosynthesis